MKALESLLEGRAQLVEQCRLTGEDSVASWIGSVKFTFEFE
jgi:hypothetical protein